jgi:glycosyltransferase involved in cell wall biosynthesis
MFKVQFISFSFYRGGAAKAASRFCSITARFAEADCISPVESQNKIYGILHFFKRLVSFACVLYFQKKSGVKCSANFFSFQPAVKALTSKNNGLINLHWVNNDTVSIFDLKKIPYASVLTMHDEWFYCGVEHSFDINEKFDKSAYFYNNNCGIKNHLSFLHYIVWSAKRSAFKDRHDLVVTCPSNWLANRARKSHAMKDCDIRVLFNPINTSLFCPIAQAHVDNARFKLGLGDRYLFIFGAIGGAKNPLKGFSELESALEILSKNTEIKDKLMLGIFGGKINGLSSLHGFPVHDFGFIATEKEMAEIYSIANVTIVPSKVEAFGQVAAESQSCATPVISFNTSGLKDVVIDGETGFLAEAFSPASLAEKIELVISLRDDQYQSLCSGARSHVIEHFSNEVIAKQYESIIKEQFLKKQEAL